LAGSPKNDASRRCAAAACQVSVVEYDRDVRLRSTSPRLRSAKPSGAMKDAVSHAGLTAPKANSVFLTMGVGEAPSDRGRSVENVVPTPSWRKTLVYKTK